MLTLPNVLAGIILVALTAYVLFGGADFGGGVWDLLASGPRKTAQRELVTHAIGPVWEANHVWLILAIVLLFTCFPTAFARIAIVLHVPLTLMLIGIVLRGSAFVFQSYGGGGGRVFATASLITPILLGIAVGSIVAGGVREAGSMGEGYYASYIAPWLTPFGVAVGLFALACFAFLAAVYLTLEADHEGLREDFRRRALTSGAAVVGTAGVGLALFHGVLAVHPGFVVLAALALLGTLGALVRRRYTRARLGAAVAVTLIVWGWGVAQYPDVLPPDLTIAAAAAPAITLRLALIAVLAGAVLLLPSLYYLLRVFKLSRRTPFAAPPTTPRAPPR